MLSNTAIPWLNGVMKTTTNNAKENTMKTTQNKTQEYKDAAIQNIARDLLGIETLDTRKSDSLDFHDLAVWSIRDALAAAFEAGRQTSR